MFTGSPGASRLPGAEQRVHGLRAQIDELGFEPRVGALGLLVDEPDRATRQDVVELEREHLFPDPLERLRRIGVTAEPARARGQELDVVQEILRAAVPELGLGLGRVGAAMKLEVELADQARQLVPFALDEREELVARSLHDAWDALQVARASQHLEHVRRGAAAAVAEAEQR